MNDKLERYAAEMISGADIDKIKEIASTDEGKQIKEMMNTAEVQEAAAKGDMDSLKKAVAQLLKTDAGAKLAGRISEMMNKK